MFRCVMIKVCDMICYVSFCLIAMIDVWLGMFNAMLIVRYMLVCVCELDSSFECAFNKVKKTQ